MPLNKKLLSERDICTKYITPALEAAGWNKHTQFLEEVSFTAGKIYVRGKLAARGQGKRADYILYYKPNIPIAIIEAKDNKHSVRAGIQQALEYAQLLDIPCVFSSNGDGFLFHDRSADQGLLNPATGLLNFQSLVNLNPGPLEQELPLDQFPSPADLWERYKRYKNITTEEEARIVGQDYYTDGSGRHPRYYQQIAINRTVEAIAKGQQRLMLVMATGTGKTYTAFQIVWRLWKAGVKKRILFLADRNALISQTKRGDFKHFGEQMTVVKNGKVDKAYEIYLALYQGLSVDAGKSGGDFESPPDFTPRGTRINEEYGKMYFLSFLKGICNVTDLFADPPDSYRDDGDPILPARTYLEDEDLSTVIADEAELYEDGLISVDEVDEVDWASATVQDPLSTLINHYQPLSTPSKVYVNGVDVTVLISRELHFDNDGKPITISLKEVTNINSSINHYGKNHFLETN